MVGKNNLSMYERYDQKQVFGLRKLSVGLASVLLGSTWLMANNVAHADTVDTSSASTVKQTTDQAMPYQNSDNQSTVNRQAVSEMPDEVASDQASARRAVEKAKQAAASHFEWYDTQDQANLVADSPSANSTVNSEANAPATSRNVADSSTEQKESVNKSNNSQQASSVSDQSTYQDSKTSWYDYGFPDYTTPDLGGVQLGHDGGTSTGTSDSGSNSGSTAPKIEYDFAYLYVYDGTDHNRYLGQTSSFGVKGETTYLSTADAIYGHSAGTWKGPSGMFVSYGSSMSITITHKVIDANRRINVTWDVDTPTNLPGGAKFGTVSGQSFWLYQPGKHDLFDDDYTWKTLANGLSNMRDHRSSVAYSSWITPSVSGVSTTVNGQSVSGFSAAIAGETNSLTGGNVGKIILSPGNNFSWVPDELNHTESNTPLTVRSNVSVSVQQETIPVELDYVCTYKLNGKTHTIKFPPDFQYGHLGDTITIDPQVPDGFALKDKTWKGKQFLLSYDGHGILRGTKSPKFKVQLKLDPQINWRYVDLQALDGDIEVNKGLQKPDAKESINEHSSGGRTNYNNVDVSKLPRPKNDPHHLHDKQGITKNYTWNADAKSDGKKIDGHKVSQSAIDNAVFLDGIGLDGKANNKDREKQINQLIYDGYDFRFYKFMHGDSDDPLSLRAQGNDASGLSGTVKYGVAMQQNTFIIDDRIYSFLNYKKALDKATQKHTDESYQKSLQQYNDSVAKKLNQKLADLQQRKAALASKIASATKVSQLKEYHAEMESLSHQYNGAVSELNTYHFSNLMHNNLKPVKAINGAFHMYDDFNGETVPVRGVTRLMSGKLVSDIVTDNDVFNASTYGYISNFNLNVHVKRNANGAYYPPVTSNGPVIGFVGRDAADGTISIDRKDHFDDPNAYEPIYYAGIPVYDNGGQNDGDLRLSWPISYGYGRNYSIDNVDGSVDWTEFNADQMDNPVIYWNQYQGYDLYINGEKQTAKHPVITFEEYYNKFLQENPDYKTKKKMIPVDYVVEYRPQVSHVKINIKDQNGNILQTNDYKGYVDSTLHLGATEYQDGTKFIDDYNDSHKDELMEYDDTDVPDNRVILPSEAKQTFTYDYNVRIYKKVLEDAGTERNHRTIEFVNLDDSTNNQASITDDVTLNAQRVYLEDGQGEKRDTAQMVYKANGSFGDASAEISQAIGGASYTITSGSQYVGAFEPEQPGSEVITVSYHGGKAKPEPVGPDHDSTDDTQKGDFSDNNQNTDDDDDPILN